MKNITLQTVVNIPKLKAKLKYEDRGLTLGSCFANNIGDKLTEGKFDFLANPLGIAYNPTSISKQILSTLTGKDYSPKQFFKHEGLWKSFDFHSDLAFESQHKTCEYINTSMQSFSAYLKSSQTIIITLGTSWIYELADTGEIVTNCHKQTPTKFKRRRLTVSEIESQLTDAFKAIFTINEDVNILLTVSPIRHLKDGAVENHLSKACLLLATSKLCNKFHNVEYFPTYEIMIDELRDYRYYADDMIHPSPLAIEIIWSKFMDNISDTDTQKNYNAVMKIIAATKHKPRNQNSDDYLQFREKILLRMSDLEEQFKYLDFSEDRKHF
ncbi:MAG: GSCFA domain-containing protein [Bacteroidales bacterium]